MFNVTIIRLKDIFKLIIIVIIIYILSRFVFKSVSIKNLLSKPINVDITNLIKLGIDSECKIFKEILEEEEKTEEVEADLEDISVKTVLNIGANILKIKENEQNIGQDTNINSEDTNIDSEQQKMAQTQEITADTNTKVVTQNPIAENYTIEYNGIKIKNETSYELTDNILNSNNLDIDKKDVIIFHTHTCESYTQSENYKYEPSRKLSYNKSKFFNSKSWR